MCHSSLSRDKRQSRKTNLTMSNYSAIQPGFNEQYEELQKNLVFTPSNTILWYECLVCHRKSATEERLNIHVQQKHETEVKSQVDAPTVPLAPPISQGNEPFKCLSCPFACTTNADLMRHSKKHKGIKPFSCKICGKTFSQKGNLKPHMLRHTGESPYPCSICNKSFNHKTSLKKHMNDHVNPRTISCRFCSKCTFSTIEQRNLHESSKHAKEDVDCIICGVILSSALGLKMHIAQMHPEIPGASEFSADKKWACQYCNKKFSTKAYLIVHHKIHRGEKPFKCQLCEYRAVSKDSVKKHAERAHGQMKMLSCNLCDKTFSYYSHKKSHMLRHYNLKPFNCNLCPRSFLLKRHLTDHLRLHKGEPSFRCDKCDVAYILPDSLRKHKDLHLSNPIKCHICCKEFWVTGRYNKHMMMHRREYNGKPVTVKKPFKCHLCGKAFKVQRFLNKHLINGCAETDDSNLECSECGMFISSLTLLKKHMKTYHNLKEYSCLVCAEPFKRIRHLVEHTEKMHPNEADKDIKTAHVEVQKDKITKYQSSTKKTLKRATGNEDITLYTLDESDSLNNILVINEEDMMQADQIEITKIKEEASEVTYECYSCGLVCLSYDELVDHQMIHDHEVTEDVKRETADITGGNNSYTRNSVDEDELEDRIVISKVEINPSSIDESDGEAESTREGAFQRRRRQTLEEDSDSCEEDEEKIVCYECSMCHLRYLTYEECQLHYNKVHKTNTKKKTQKWGKKR